jgi:hypothetical protein
MELRCPSDELGVETRRFTLFLKYIQDQNCVMNQPRLKGMMALCDPRSLHLLARTFLLHNTSEVGNLMLFCNCSISSQEFTHGVAIQGIDPATPLRESFPALLPHSDVSDMYINKIPRHCNAEWIYFIYRRFV